MHSLSSLPLFVSSFYAESSIPNVFLVVNLGVMVVIGIGGSGGGVKLDRMKGLWSVDLIPAWIRVRDTDGLFVVRKLELMVCIGNIQPSIVLLC